MPIKMLLNILIGVACLGVVFAEDQSEVAVVENQPITSQETEQGLRKIDTPEVVLSLKYDGGELNRIYLAQYRKTPNQWTPSVAKRNELCTDLCHAGLGGTSCGPSCKQLMPVGLQSALTTANITNPVYGFPRTGVCPTLCQNRLGDPLCMCKGESSSMTADWASVCAAFCIADNYVIGGCPPCEESAAANIATSAIRALTTSEGWSLWCDVQCRQGQGGAACNCDRAPFQ